MSVDIRSATDKTSLRPRIRVAVISLYAFLILAAISWGYILLRGGSGFEDLFLAQTWQDGADFIGRLAGKGSSHTPAFLQWIEWAKAGKLAYETLAMSVLAIGIAGLGVLATFLPAARNVSRGELAPSRGILWRSLFFIVRGLFIFSRGTPELVIAMIIIFFLSPGILPGALALGLHNYGILGKLMAEVVENLDPRPARALRAAGAGSFQMLFYAILPQALPQFLTYLLYRWEVVIRTTIIIGFVGASGLGKEFRLSMSFFQYTDIALLLIWYLLLVVLVDLVSTWLRRLAR